MKENREGKVVFSEIRKLLIICFNAVIISINEKPAMRWWGMEKGRQLILTAELASNKTFRHTVKSDYFNFLGSLTVKPETFKLLGHREIV